MREILFRGKGIDGNWYYGVPLVFTEDYVCMTAPYTYNKAVIPETIGQYTGLTANGKKIFEGDIILYDDSITVVRYGRIGFDSGIGLSGFALTFDDDAQETDSDTGEKFYECNRNLSCKEAEVIGNIHDNSELLKGESNEAD